MNEKKKESILLLGDVNSGKSTTIGSLFRQLRPLSDDILQILQNEIGERDYTPYTWILERIKHFKELNINLNNQINTFETLNFEFTISEVPGHKNFMKNLMLDKNREMIAILIVSATENEKISNITQQHLLLAIYFGFPLIICINKMDDQSVNFSQSKFENIKRKLQKIIQKFQPVIENFLFIPLFLSPLPQPPFS